MLTLLLLAAAQDKPAAAPASMPVKKVCRSEQTIGSRIPSARTCRTPAEWAAVDKLRSDRTLDQVRRDQVR